MQREEEAPKVVVFDLDETLGYFTEFAIFFDIVTKYAKIKPRLHQKVFSILLDLYPEYLRPHIIFILTFLKSKKKLGECYKVLIYTNNRGPPSWAHMIKTYLEEKVKFPLFDKIVGAFKVNGRIVEVCRSTSEKTTEDLLRCAKLPRNTQICFIDDTNYEKMENVYYIKLSPYIYNLSLNVLVSRFIHSNIAKEMNIKEEDFVHFVNVKAPSYVYKYENKEEEELKMDKIVSKKLYMFLEEFF